MTSTKVLAAALSVSLLAQSVAPSAAYAADAWQTRSTERAFRTDSGRTVHRSLAFTEGSEARHTTLESENWVREAGVWKLDHWRLEVSPQGELLQAVKTTSVLDDSLRVLTQGAATVESVERGGAASAVKDAVASALASGAAEPQGGGFLHAAQTTPLASALADAAHTDSPELVAAGFERIADNSAGARAAVAANVFVSPRSMAPTPARLIPQSEEHNYMLSNTVPTPASPSPAPAKPAKEKDCETGFTFARGVFDAMKTNLGGTVVDRDAKMPRGRCKAYKRGRKFGHVSSIILSGAEVAGGAAVIVAQIVAAVKCSFTPGAVFCWKALSATMAASISVLIHGVFHLYAAIMNLSESERLAEADVVRMLGGEIVDNPPARLRNKTVFKVKNQERDLYIAVHETRSDQDRLVVYDKDWKCIGLFEANLKTRISDCPAGW
ncbi:MAG: hypothetical protein HY078_01545 [Elusimicrobia bacterium]|nr:hypothetical protein [Elusimicrobiota bacterium]